MKRSSDMSYICPFDECEVRCKDAKAFTRHVSWHDRNASSLHSTSETRTVMDSILGDNESSKDAGT